jgi:hypothetical protein
MKPELVVVRENSTSLLLTLAGLALSFAPAACGGDGGSCGTAACGGDVAGNWQASSACVDKATLNMEFLAGIMGSCPDASLGNVSMTPHGTVAFTADMMFTGTLVVDSRLDMVLPAACTNGASCADLTAALQGALVGTNGVTSATCAGTSGCTCTLAQTVDSINDSGTWATSGSTLTVTGATNGAQAGPYCVKGSALHLLQFDSGTMMKVVGDIILNKQ